MVENSLTLRRRLESPPQELYDEIYNLTFTASPGERKLDYNDNQADLVGYLDDRSKRFHGHDSINLFLVDRASSHEFAESYYGGEGAVFSFSSIDRFWRWATKLGEEHKAMVQDCRLICTCAYMD